MGQQLVGGGTTADVHAETHAEERLELLAQLLRFLQARGAVRGNQVQSLQGLFIQIRWLGFDHLNRHDTK